MASTTKPLSGNDLPGGSGGLTLADVNFIRNALQNLNTASSTYGITAAGTTQATATQLGSVLNQVDTTAASTGVNLPYSGGTHNTPYQFCIVWNNGASTLAVYAAQGKTDTINGIAGSTGVTIPAGSSAIFNSAKVGAWFTSDSAEAGSFTTITSTGLATLAGISDSSTLTFTTVGSGIIQKQGANGKVGTFTLTGTTQVTVSNTSIATTDVVCISLNTVGGTVGAVPSLKTITAGTGFNVSGTAGDTSIYNYQVLSSAL